MTWSTTATMADGMLDDRRAGAFRAAARHTRLVGILRLAVPFSSAVAVAAFIAAVMARHDDAPAAPDLPVSNSALTMISPKMRGFDNERRPYEILARRAEQSIAAPNLVDLDQIDAKLQFGDKSWAQLVASTGKLDSEKQVLNLEHAIKIKTDTGDEMELARAHVQLKEGDIVSDAPVRATMGSTVLGADRMSIVDKGDRLVFEGHVVVLIQPDENGAGILPAKPR